MLTLAVTLDDVIGVDIHKYTLAAAAVSPTRPVLDEVTVPSDAKGCRRLMAFGERHDGRLWALEGTGNFRCPPDHRPAGAQRACGRG